MNESRCDVSTRPLIIAAALLLTCAGVLSAQDLAGNWQGALGAPPRQLRVVLRVQKSDAGWKATFASIDQTPDWGAALPVESVTLQGTSLKFSVGSLRGTYEGTLAADGNSI